MSTSKPKSKKPPKKVDVAAWHAVLDAMFHAEHTINLPFGYKRDIYYRGQPDSRYSLLPSLGRLKDPSPALLENNFYSDFRTFGSPYLPKGLKALETLAYMQHYGLPTRLLDWSTNFLSALFFAVEGCWDLTVQNPAKAPKACTVWLLSPFDLNRKTTKDGTIYPLQETVFPYEKLIHFNYLKEAGKLASHALKRWLSVNRGFQNRLKILPSAFAVLPFNGDNRMRFQDAAFTFHYELTRPLEVMIPEIRRIDIPAKVVPIAREFLRCCGINGGVIYPGLDGVARHIRNGWNYIPFETPTSRITPL
jgi:hypothetical protein